MKKFMLIMLVLVVILFLSGCQKFASKNNDTITGSTVADDAKEDTVEKIIDTVDLEKTDKSVKNKEQQEETGDEGLDSAISLVGEAHSAKTIKALYPDLRKINVVFGPFDYRLSVVFSTDALLTFFVDDTKDVVLGVCYGYYSTFTQGPCYSQILE